MTAATVALLAAGCGLFGPTPEERVQQAAALQDSIERRETFLEIAAEPHPDMRPRLQQMLRENRDPTLRALAAEALGRLGTQKDAGSLRDAVRNDRHWLVRKRSLTWLSRIQGAEVTDELRHVLQNDPNALVRAEAVTLALLHSGETDLYPALLQGLQDRSGAVRLLACVELQNLTGGSYPPAPGPWQPYLRRSGLLQSGQ
ncbi:MAG: HEAT repeat domain-containing protein [Planctomycetota bacterium]